MDELSIAAPGPREPAAKNRPGQGAEPERETGGT